MNIGQEPPLHAETPSHAWRLPLIIATLVGLAVLAGILWLGRPNSEQALPPVPAELPPLSPAAQRYLPRIAVGEPRLSRWQNFLGQEVTYLDLAVSNRGNRTVRAMELTIEFHNAYGIVVLRETLRPIGAPRPSPVRPTGPLPPGDTREVRAAFEHIPAEWDRRPPEVRVTGLLLQ